MKKSRKQNNRDTYQTLEPRKMLAGDVTATFNDGLLQIIGDAEGNEIVVAGRPDGTATVFPLGDTTINGATDPFVVTTSIDDVDVQLNQGDDNATIQGLVLPQSLRVRTNAGDDTTFVHHIEVQRFEQFAGDGNDTLEFNNVYSRGSLLISGENNDDIISITNMAAGTNATLETGNGADTVAIDNLGVVDDINLNTGGADDQVILTGLVYGYRANFLLEQGNDSLNILPEISGETARFQRRLNIEGGDGNDSISLDASVTSPRATRIDGDDATDSFEQAGASLRRSSIRNIENLQVDNLDALLDSVYDTLTAADIDTSPFGLAVIFDPIESIEPTISTTATALVQNENGGAQALDGGLELFGGNPTFTGATIGLGETFADDQDVLAFDDNDTADAITGTFDATTGTLTLSGDGTADEYQAALRAITFDNTSENPDETQRRATITLARENGDALTATRDITVVAIDDDPVVEQASSTININLDEDPTLPVSIGIDELTTPNTGTTQLSAAVVVIDDGFVPGDVLGFTEVDGITGDYNPETGVLSLTGSADVTDYQSVLSSVTFDFDQSAASGQRRISYEATDVTGTFIVDELLVNVITNASVVLQTSDNVLPFFTEGGAPINVDTGLTIAAADDATVNEALVAITSGFSSGDDFLSFDRRLAIEEDINGSYDFETGELTFSGDASAETYQRLLRTVTYHSIDQTIPESGTRDIQYSIISDGDFSVRRTATVTPRTEAQRTEPIADRDERLIQQFIAANNLTTQTTASGLHYIVETEGNGQFPEATDDIVATYTGRYLNGVKFDNGTDVPFNLSGVIEGWTEGFQFFSPGGTGQLLIPSALAYGALGTSGGAGIPPNTVIQFDVEFVSNVTQDSA